MLFFFFIILYFLNACSFFEEEEIILPGKRVDVFEKKTQKLIKSNKDVELSEPLTIKDWPMNNQNTFNSPPHFQSNKSIKFKWKKKTSYKGNKNNYFITKPVVHKDQIFTVLANSKINVFDFSTGNILWEEVLPKEIKEEVFFSGGLGVEGNTLFITTGLGNLYSIDIQLKKIIWEKNFTSPISSPPVVFDNKVFFITDDNQTIAIEKSNGKEIWRHSGSLENVSIIGGVSPAIKDNVLYVTYTSGEIFALNLENGSTLWFENIALGSIVSRNLIFDIQSSPVIQKDKLIASSYINKLIALNTTDGEKLWEVELSTVNPIITSGDYAFILDTDNKLHCLSLDNGTSIWTVQLKKISKNTQIRWLGPLLTSKRLIVASSEGIIVSISPFTGEMLGQIDSKFKFSTNPIQAKKTIFFVTQEGTLVALE